MKCAVSNCHCNSLTNEKCLSFFSFPKNTKLAKQWILFCGNPKLINTEYSLICSQHFKTVDIIVEMGVKSKVRLRPGAVPCIENTRQAETPIKMSKRENSENLIEESLDEMDTEESKSFLQQKSDSYKTITKSNASQIDDFLDMECYEAVIDELTNQNKTLQVENMRLNVNMQLAAKKYKKEIKKVTKRLQNANLTISQLEAHLGTVCTIEQINEIKMSIKKGINAE